MILRSEKQTSASSGIVGTSKVMRACRWSSLGRPWEQVRPGLDVKLLAHEGELYVQAQSQDRVSKERAMRRLYKLVCPFGPKIAPEFEVVVGGD